MIYAVWFEDNPDRAEMRAKHMAQHLAFLDRHATHIRAAGPLTEAASGLPAGGLWIVDAEDQQAVRDLIEADPFWPTGLRKDVRVLTWTQVFARGQRQVLPSQARSS